MFGLYVTSDLNNKQPLLVISSNCKMKEDSTLLSSSNNGAATLKGQYRVDRAVGSICDQTKKCIKAFIVGHDVDRGVGRDARFGE